MKHYFKIELTVCYDHDHENDDYPPDIHDMRDHLEPIFTEHQNHRHELCEEIQRVGEIKIQSVEYGDV